MAPTGKTPLPSQGPSSSTKPSESPSASPRLIIDPWSEPMSPSSQGPSSSTKPSESGLIIDPRRWVSGANTGSLTSPPAPKRSDTLAPTMATDVPTEDLVGRKMRSTTKEESSPIHDAGYERALSSGKSGKSSGKSAKIAKVVKVREDESSAKVAKVQRDHSSTEDNTVYTTPIHDAGYERALSSGKSGKSPGKSVNIAKVAKVQEDESSAEDNTAYTIKSVKKIAHATLIDTKMAKPGRHETYETNEDVEVDLREKVPRPFGRTKAAKRTKVLNSKGGK
eukprot:CAMPEP_0201988312 /NCGR_PEP_ID=MMETSP0904-20121228/92263_1 /ASSEMBLY_ACC=CAM_ASM_000553 /TAXON_ID=420261 /ORGANISM="Thalassiosira antarctica, Strain CCMP982" /LENGTH=279 /DNA_ID=CAMNT_0048542473 /DNA_START=35 /DNA_END=874 /DNA_ORIENTATION=+